MGGMGRHQNTERVLNRDACLNSITGTKDTLYLKSVTVQKRMHGKKKKEKQIAEEASVHLAKLL